MNMIEYQDAITGYTCRRYAKGPDRHAKLYFTCENYSLDDRYFFFTKERLVGLFVKPV